MGGGGERGGRVVRIRRKETRCGVGASSRATDRKVFFFFNLPRGCISYFLIRFWPNKWRGSLLPRHTSDLFFFNSWGRTAGSHFFAERVFGHEMGRERSVSNENYCKRLRISPRDFLAWFWKLTISPKNWKIQILRFKKHENSQNRFSVTKWVENGPFQLKIGANGSKWRCASFSKKSFSGDKFKNHGFSRSYWKTSRLYDFSNVHFETVFFTILMFFSKIVPGMHFQVHSAWKNVPELIAANGLGQKPYICIVFEVRFFNVFPNIFINSAVF